MEVLQIAPEAEGFHVLGEFGLAMIPLGMLKRVLLREYAAGLVAASTASMNKVCFLWNRCDISNFVYQGHQISGKLNSKLERTWPRTNAFQNCIPEG